MRVLGLFDHRLAGLAYDDGFATAAVDPTSQHPAVEAVSVFDVDVAFDVVPHAAAAF